MFVVAQQGGTVRTTDVQAHVGRVATIEAVAVDAALELCILYQRTLVERGEVAFINPHLAPYLVAWRNETVAETVIDTVRTDVDGERSIGMPAIVKLGRNGHAERVATILIKQGVPVVKVEVNGPTPVPSPKERGGLAVQAVAVTIGNDGINTQCSLIGHVKAQRRNVHGYSNTEIVGIDLRLNVFLLCIADRFGATDKKQKRDEYV